MATFSYVILNYSLVYANSCASHLVIVISQDAILCVCIYIHIYFIFAADKPVLPAYLVLDIK